MYTHPLDRIAARYARRRRWRVVHVWYPLLATLIMLAGSALAIAAVCVLLRALNVGEGLPADYPCR